MFTSREHEYRLFSKRNEFAIKVKFDVFGSIGYFICEDEDYTAGMAFSLRNEELIIEKIKQDEVVSFHPVRKRKFGFFEL